MSELVPGARRLALTVGLVAVLGLATAQAAHGWSPVRIPWTELASSTASSKMAVGCDLAMRDDGSFLVTWKTSSRIGLRGRGRPPYVHRAFVAEFRRGQGWGSRRQLYRHTTGLRGSIVLKGTYASCPRIALGAGRRADVVWDASRVRPVDPKRSSLVRSGPDAVFRVVRTPAGRWTRARRWIRGAVVDRVLSNGSGDATVAVTREVNRRRRQLAMSRVAGGAWRRQDFAARTMADTRDPVAFGRGGGAVVFPGRGSVAASRTLYVRAWDRPRWRQPQAVPATPSGCRLDPESAKVTAEPGAVAVVGVCTTSDDEAGVQMAVRRGSVWTLPERVDTAQPISGSPEGPYTFRELAPADIQLEPGGAVRVSWTSTRWTGDSSMGPREGDLFTSSLQPGATELSPPRNVGRVAGEPVRSDTPNTPFGAVTAFLDNGAGLRAVSHSSDGAWKVSSLLDRVNPRAGWSIFGVDRETVPDVSVAGPWAGILNSSMGPRGVTIAVERLG